MPAVANPCCCGKCLIFSDNFNRANETWPASPAFDSTGKWVGARSFTDHNPWRISSNQLAITTTTEAVNAILPLASHKENINITAASVAVKSKIPTGGASHVAVTIRTNLVTGDSRVWSAYVKLIPSEDACGVMQLWDNNIGGASQLGPDIPVPGLDFGTYHNVRICLDAELNLVSCEVDGNWHHGTVSSADDAGDPLHQVVGSLWVDETISGTYYFDDFKLVELKQQIGYGYYYGYGYGDEPHCPCCHRGCDARISDRLDDCMWDGLQWLGSSSGWNSDCLPDRTVAAALTTNFTDYGQSESITFGDLSATVTNDSSLGAGDGQVSIADGGGGNSASISLGIGTVGLQICVVDRWARASANGAAQVDLDLTLDINYADIRPTIAFDGTFELFTIFHDLLNPDCAGTCFGGSSEAACPACEPPGTNTTTPQFLMVGIDGLEPGELGLSCCSSINGGYILELSIITPCCWTWTNIETTCDLSEPCAHSVSACQEFIGDGTYRWVVSVGICAVIAISYFWVSDPIPLTENNLIDCSLIDVELHLVGCADFGHPPPCTLPCLTTELANTITLSRVD